MTQPHPTTPEHRKRVLDAIGRMWALVPHLRLGQLVANSTDVEKLFYMRDDSLTLEIESYLDSLNLLGND